MPDPAFTIRELEERDLSEAVQVLAEGFPRLSRTYWESCLRIIKDRNRIPGTPQFGYGIEDGGLQGVVLALGSLHGPDNRHTIVNLSSWTVRRTHRGRGVAKELLRHASSFEGFTYSDLSAAAHTIKAVTQLGFKESTAGQVLAVGLRKEPRRPLRIISVDDAERAGLAPEKAEMLRHHASYRCIVFCPELEDQLAPLIFLPRKVQGIFPLAQLIYCEKMEDFLDNSRSIYLRLLSKGFPALLIDGSGPIPGLKGRYFPGKAARYYKGPFPQYAVDHTYSEMTIIGF